MRLHGFDYLQNLAFARDRHKFLVNVVAIFVNHQITDFISNLCEEEVNNFNLIFLIQSCDILLQKSASLLSDHKTDKVSFGAFQLIFKFDLRFPNLDY